MPYNRNMKQNDTVTKCGVFLASTQIKLKVTTDTTLQFEKREKYPNEVHFTNLRVELPASYSHFRVLDLSRLVTRDFCQYINGRSLIFIHLYNGPCLSSQQYMPSIMNRPNK